MNTSETSPTLFLNNGTLMLDFSRKNLELECPKQVYGVIQASTYIYQRPRHAIRGRAQHDVYLRLETFRSCASMGLDAEQAGQLGIALLATSFAKLSHVEKAKRAEELLSQLLLLSNDLKILP